MNHRNRSLKKLMPLTAAVLLAVTLLTTRALAATSAEGAATTVNLPKVTLAANTSYVSDDYFGVLHLNVGDDSVACASVDSENHVVVTAVAKGSTTVNFWYQKTTGGSWISAVLPITVSGTSGVAQTVSSKNVGLVLPEQSVSLNVGGENTMSGITLNGESVSASSLLWISSSESVFTVGRDTEKFMPFPPVRRRFMRLTRAPMPVPARR